MNEHLFAPACHMDPCLIGLSTGGPNHLINCLVEEYIALQDQLLNENGSHMTGMSDERFVTVEDLHSRMCSILLLSFRT